MKKNQYIIPEVVVDRINGGLLMLLDPSGSDHPESQAPARSSAPVRNTLIVK